MLARKALILSMALALMAACRQGHRQMTASLEELERMNNADSLMTNDSLAMAVAGYFDSHGTPNERLRAHYMLGRTYADMGEAPAAINEYHRAVECADTTADDCNLSQLSKVYSQMAYVFYSQGLYREQLECIKNAVQLAWQCKDTLLALASYEQECFAYSKLDMRDSAIFVIEDVASQYERLGRKRDAAISKGPILRTLLETGQFDKARHYIGEYEAESGYFTEEGDIEAGREIYYNVKGLYCLYTNSSDSAEFYFRKELGTGKDFNNQHAAARGLADMFQLRHQPDSTAKYALYAYTMMDSVYSRMTTKEVKRIQAMYQYTRNQTIARQKSEEAEMERERLKTFALLSVVVAMIFGLVFHRLYKKGKDGLKLYRQSLADIQALRQEKQALGMHAAEYKSLIAEKEKTIKDLEKRISRYGKQACFNTANAERCLKGSSTYQRLEGMAIKGMSLPDEEWNSIYELANEYLPGFCDFLEANRHSLKVNDYRICLLLRLHFKPVDIAGMTGMSKSLVSQHSTEILRKLFNAKGSSKELSVKLAKIF